MFRQLIFVILFLFSYSAVPQASYNEHELLISKKLLADAIRLFNGELRNSASGQYYDAINLNSAETNETNSSTAATGMGLVSLAIGDATGTVQDANIKTVQTLAAVLNPKYSRRHSQGWMRHWFTAQDGRDNAWSAADGYSTIDTAILAAGAVLNANYFKAAGKDPLNVIADLTDKLLTSVNWSSAIADMNSGRLIMNYGLENEAAEKITAKFNEYILVSCVGKLAENRKGIQGPMTRFWDLHFANPDSLPQKIYLSNQGPLRVLTDHPAHYLSSFTIQFAYYLCGEVNNNSKYVQFFKNAQLMDHDWFLHQSMNREGLWGSGAGEAIRGYQANSAFNNPDLIVSPHIISGFMSEKPELLSTLAEMYKEKNFSYFKNEKEVLWRKSLTRPEVSLSRLQAVDFSTMIFGLAAVQPELGPAFFKTYAARSK